MDDVLTLVEAAKVIGRKPGTVRGYTKYADLPYSRTGPCGAIQIRRSELAEWMARPETAQMLAAGALINAHRFAVPA